jgi:signal peptidase II
MSRNWIYPAIIAALAALDQATKAAVARSVDLYQSVPVIPGFFNITHIHNTGAIFGFFSRSESLPVLLALTAAQLLALGFVVYYFIKTPAAEIFTKITLCLILAGALGNLFDRVFRGYVIDFLDFYIKQEHFPFFNVADSCITVGATLLIIIFLRRKPECSPSS